MRVKIKVAISVLVLVAVAWLLKEFVTSGGYIVTPGVSEQAKTFNQGDIDDIRAFLAQPNSRINMDNYYALIDRNRADILEMMFKEFDLDPDYEFQYEYATPLLAAAKSLKPDVVSVLLKYGADVNYKDPYGVTPLIAAAYTTFSDENPASFEITKLLVEAGADVNARSDVGRSALGGALSGIHDDLKRAVYLIKNTTQPELINKHGTNYMFYCNSIDCYEYFLALGVDVNSINSKGENILQTSVYAELNLRLVQELLRLGVNICHIDDSENSILEHVEKYDLGLHQDRKEAAFYKEKVKENRQSAVYQFLEKEYKEQCE